VRLLAPLSRRAPERGFSILELMISSTVFVLVAGAVVTALVVSNSLNMTNRETALASRAAQSMLEELKACEFSEVFACYDGTAADDPAGGGSPGANFAVNGLDVQADDDDGLAGAIEFPGTGTTLREDENDPELGMPRDLDGDTNVDAVNHSGDYRILPVRVVVRWTGQNGPRTFEVVTVLADY